MHESVYPICRHTKANGRRCQAPALTGRAFCRHHHNLRRTTRDVGPGYSANALYSLRSAQSIQGALAMVLSGLASGRIHPATGSKMIYAIQLAMDLPPTA